MAVMHREDVRNAVAPMDPVVGDAAVLGIMDLVDTAYRVLYNHGRVGESPERTMESCPLHLV